MKKSAKELAEILREQYEPRSDDNVLEIMHEIYARLPWNQSITLANGKSFILKKFIEPQCNVDKGGIFEFGFDAQFTDGSGHIEFNVTKSGWEFRVDDDVEE